jgi:periplasmic divalent cation tolerance protein
VPAAQVCQLQVAHSDRDALQAIVEDLLDLRLIACGQLLGPLASSFSWRGTREHEQEWLALMKTASHRVQEASARVRELHSYELPEILVSEMSGGDPEYLSWVLESTREQPR